MGGRGCKISSKMPCTVSQVPQILSCPCNTRTGTIINKIEMLGEGRSVQLWGDTQRANLTRKDLAFKKTQWIDQKPGLHVFNLPFRLSPLAQTGRYRSVPYQYHPSTSLCFPPSLPYIISNFEVYETRRKFNKWKILPGRNGRFLFSHFAHCQIRFLIRYYFCK